MVRRALLVSCLSCGCSLVNDFEDPPIVGDWAGLQDVRNAMSIEVDGDGEVALFYVLQAAPDVGHRDDFDVSWEHDDGNTFELRMTCAGSTFSCADNNPVLVCDINDEEDELDCATTHPFWANYPALDWGPE